MAKQKLLQRIIDAVRGKDDNNTKTPYLPAGYEATGYGFDTFNPKQKEYLHEMKGWVSACTNSISDEIASIDLKLYKKTKEGVEEIEEHPILDVLYRVNDFTTKFDHFWLTQTYLELAGEAPWFLERVNGEVAGIYFLSPDKITPITGEGKLIAGYKYRAGMGKEIILKPEEIIFLKYPNPAKPFRGMGTLEQAARIVDIDNYSEEWNKKFYENSARPDSVLTVDVESLSKQQKDELKTSINKQYKGVKNAHNLMVLFGNMKFDKSGFSQRDMDFLEQQKFSRDKILGIFRVPKAIVSQTEGVNFASAKTANYVFARYTIKPKMERLVQQLNEFLLPQFNGTEEMFLDFDSPVPEDEETQSKIWAEGIKAGYLTINEVRREKGLPDVDGGDAIYLPLNVAPIGVEKEDESKDEDKKAKSGNRVLVMPIKKEDEKEKAYRLHKDRIREVRARSKEHYKHTEDMEKNQKEIFEQVKAGIWKAYKKQEAQEKSDAIPRRKMNKEQIHNYWQIKNNIWKVYSEKVIDVMIDVFRKQRSITLPKFDKYFKGVAIDVTSVYDSVKLNVTDEIKRTMTATIPTFSELYKEAADESFKLVGIEMEMDLARADVQQYIDTSSRKMANNVTETTNELIKKQIITGLTNTENMEQIRDRVKSVFVEAEDSRAMMISRSESLRYNTHASEQAFKDSGLVEGKMWVTNPNPCPQCASLEGITVGLGKNYLNKGESINDVKFDYEDITAPPLHPNCECDLIPIFLPTESSDGFSIGKKDEQEMTFDSKELKRIGKLDNEVRIQTSKIVEYTEGNSKLTKKEIVKILKDKKANDAKLYEYTTVKRLPDSVIKNRQKRYVDYITNKNRIKTAKELNLDKHVIFTGGIPASGKSSMIKDLDKSKYVWLDCDAVKAWTPEYKKLNFLSKAAMVHDESSNAVRVAFDKALANGQNIIFDGTFKNSKKYAELIDLAKGKGYTTMAYVTDVDPNIAISRAVARYEKTGRLPSLNIIANAQKGVSETTKLLKDTVDKFKLYNNAGKKSKLIMEQFKDESGKIIIKNYNKKQVDIFLENKYETIFSELKI